MSDYVVDAGIAAKWFFPEIHTDSALLMLRKENRLHSPDIILLEFDSIICKRIRRGEITVPGGHEIHSALRLFPVHRHSFELLLVPAYELATHSGVGIYDSLYVALAVLLKCPMVTADRHLYNSLRDGPYGRHLVWVGDLGGG
jgi:predicted nucleic acid-binding protein